MIGFKYVSSELREVADLFISGYLIPGLLPIGAAAGENRQRGIAISYNQDRGFGFMRYYSLGRDGLVPHSVFFHCSKAPEINDTLFLDSTNIFEFSIVKNQDNNSRTEAWDIHLVNG